MESVALGIMAKSPPQTVERWCCTVPSARFYIIRPLEEGRRLFTKEGILEAEKMRAKEPSYWIKLRSAINWDGSLD